jgi:IclR family transcriptional regulator, pca regulon regulatory protein
VIAGNIPDTMTDVQTGQRGEPDGARHRTGRGEAGAAAGRRAARGGGRAAPPFGESNPRHSKSLVKGLAILRSFAADRPLRGIADTAGDLDMERSTTHRFMSTFVVLGFLEQDASRKYRLATNAADIGIAALDSHPLRRQSARTALAELRSQTGHTASLGVLVDDELLYLERLRGSGQGQREIDLGILGLRVGCRLPAYCTAMGKLLLASLPEPERRKRIARLKLTRTGQRSIASKTALGQELRNIEAIGLALSDGELAEVLVSIAAPVRDDAGTVVAAVALEAHAAMATPKGLLRDTSPLLSAAAVRLGECLAPTSESAGTRTVPRLKPANGGRAGVALRSGLSRIALEAR